MIPGKNHLQRFSFLFSGDFTLTATFDVTETRTSRITLVARCDHPHLQVLVHKR